MRGAFVVRLASESEPGQDRFEGWIEEVDTAKQLRFRSAAELLQFMRERYALAKASDRIATRANDLHQRANPAGPEKD